MKGVIIYMSFNNTFLKSMLLCILINLYTVKLVLRGHHWGKEKWSLNAGDL
jgi:hypothetical protein